MTRKFSVMLLPLVLLAQGCSLFRNGDNEKPNIQLIRSRVALVANIALGLEPVQPFRAQLCDSVNIISQQLDQLQDKDITKTQITEFVMGILDQRLHGQVLGVAKLVLTFVLDRVWDQYADLLENDSVIIVMGIAGGLSDACDLVVPFSSTTIDTSSLEADLQRLLD